MCTEIEAELVGSKENVNEKRFYFEPDFNRLS
jgi:hypothetical protein